MSEGRTITNHGRSLKNSLKDLDLKHIDKLDTKTQACIKEYIDNYTLTAIAEKNNLHYTSINAIITKGIRHLESLNNPEQYTADSNVNDSGQHRFSSTNQPSPESKSRKGIKNRKTYITDILNSRVSEDDNRTMFQVCLDKQTELAAAGDLNALKWLYEAENGKPMQESNVNVQQKQFHVVRSDKPTPINTNPSLTPAPPKDNALSEDTDTLAIDVTTDKVQ
jgi:hypothetical protein